MSSELHIPTEVADAMRALRPELRKKLSLRDIDDMTRPFRKRIEELKDAIRKGPHQMGCHSLQKPNTPGWASLELCDCWKRKALEGEFGVGAWETSCAFTLEATAVLSFNPWYAGSDKMSHRDRLEMWHLAVSEGEPEPELLFDLAESAVVRIEELEAAADAVARIVEYELRGNMDSVCDDPRCHDSQVPIDDGARLALCGRCALIRARERIAELKNIILEAPHHEDCALLYWESGTPRSPCDCWKRKALEDG